MASKIAFYGGYTLWSAGDDAPLAFMVQALKKQLPEYTEYVVFCRHPDKEFEENFGVRTVRNFEYDSKALSEGKWMRGLNFADDRSELRRIAEEIDSASLLVLGAGNFITEVSFDVLRGHLSQFLVLTYIAELCGTPVYFYGLSANKIGDKWARLAVQRMLRSASAVTFREPFAVQNLVDSGISLPPYKLLPDPALGAPIGNVARGLELAGKEGIELGNRPVVAMSLRDLSWMNGNKTYERTITAFLEHWLHTTGGAAIFIPQCTYHVEDPRTDDRYVADRIMGKLSRTDACFVVRGEYFYKDIQSFYSLADMSVATRLHGAVFSAMMGVPVIGLAYESKVAGFFRQINMSEWCLPWDVDSHQLIALANTMKARKEDIARGLEANVSDAKSRVSEYVNIAVGILDESEVA